MALLWTDGTWTTESAVSGFRYESPIPGNVTALIREQDFQVFAANYSPPAISTVSDTSWYFTGDINFQDLGGGAIRFTRQWAKIPSAHSEWETFAYSFIGFFGAYGPDEITPTGRDRMVLAVPSRIYHEYFLCASGQTYTTPGAIPVIQAMKYRLAPAGYSYWMDIDWLCDNPPFTVATTPDRSTYAGWVQNAQDHGWSAGKIVYTWTNGVSPSVSTTGTESDPAQIAAEDSKIDRWRGDIFVRRTRYILAQ